jgi:putative transposase
MAKAYSQDLRERVLEAVEKGGMSRRGAADRFGVSEASAVKMDGAAGAHRVTDGGADGRLQAPQTGASPGLSGGRAGREGGHHVARPLRPAFGGARRQSRHLDDEPLLPPDRRHVQKKTVVAREQDRPDIRRHRARWRTYQGLIDPSRLVFIDETWTKTNMTRLRGWAAKGKRLIDRVPQGKWKTATFLAALRHDRIEAPCLFDGPINGERFHAYVEHFLVPTLRKGDVVILDNLGSHKGKAVRRAIRNIGARLVFLPKYSPDLNPIEQAFAKLKGFVRKRAPRTFEAISAAIADALQTVTPNERANYLANAGYASG